MASRWEPPERETVDIEIEERPSRDRQRAARERPTSATPTTVDAARRAARALRIVAWFIAATSVLGYVLVSFWRDDEGYFIYGESLRVRIGNLLTSIGIPFALAALVYAASFLVTLYAARLELDAARVQEQPSR